MSRSAQPNGFAPVSAAAWKKSVEKDLKGADYGGLVWKPAGAAPDTPLEIEPFYCPEHMKGLSLFPAPPPGVFPHTREVSSWEVCEDIPPSPLAASARMARESIEGGADGILFREAKASTPAQISKLLSGIDPARTGVRFAPKGAGIAQARALAEFFAKSAIKKPRGFVLCDPLGSGKAWEMKSLAALVREFDKSARGFGCVGVRAERFHEAGAEPVEEAAFALAAGAEYLCALSSLGVAPRMAARAMVFHFAVGSAFFLEAAKIRAARAVWAHIVEKFDRRANGRMTIHASPSSTNKPVCDPEVNILRATCETMAAVAGGCGSVSVPAFDGRYAPPSARSQAVSRNIQLILRDECGLGAVADPCAGSYYADTLTDKAAGAILDLFLEIEKRGGFAECARSGFVRRRLRESAKRRAERVASGAEPLIGVNKYPLEGERMAARLKNGAFGAAREFERLRASAERGKTPRVFLVKTGDAAMRSARAVFAVNFFAAAGFEITDGGAFKTARAAANAATASGADIFVICSEDSNYGRFAPQFASLVRKKRKNAAVAAAGRARGEDEEKCEKAGVSFINTRSNILETLKQFQKAAGGAK